VSSIASPPVEAPSIELDGLSVTLGGKKVLDRLEARVSGRAVGLLGPNGAGKSTLMRTLLGFHSPSEGTARVLGTDIRGGRAELGERIGYMPENEAFVADMSGVALVRLMGELSGLPAGVALERAHATLLFLGMDEERYRPVGTCSVGMRQMVRLAVAAVDLPPLLILDEPTNGLDTTSRRRMIDILLRIRDSGHTRLLMSSHLLHDVEACCDEVLILKNGRVVEHADLDKERRTNRKFIHLEVTGPPDLFRAHALRAGCEVSGESGDSLRITLPETLEIRDLYGIADGAGVLIGRLSCKRDSLEEIFMRAMESDGDR
jgi:ABC-2 type transport system ATP-binding protein